MIIDKVTQIVPVPLFKLSFIILFTVIPKCWPDIRSMSGIDVSVETWIVLDTQQNVWRGICPLVFLLAATILARFVVSPLIPDYTNNSRIPPLGVLSPPGFLCRSSQIFSCLQQTGLQLSPDLFYSTAISITPCISFAPSMSAMHCLIASTGFANMTILVTYDNENL